VAQFNNASVEEFIESFLRSEPSSLEQLPRSIVCFRQVRELASQTSGKEPQRTLPAPYWMSLRNAAERIEAIYGGYLINFRSYGDSVRRVWDTGKADAPRQALLRFQIESHVGLSDPFFLKLQKTVLTSDGWHALITGVQYDSSHAYGVKSLHEWIMRESGWSDDAKATCHEAFRQAVLEIIEDGNEIWSCSINSLRIFAESITVDGTFLTDREKASFHEAGKLIAGTIVENEGDAGDIDSEADELSKLQDVCGVTFAKEIEALQTESVNRSQRPSSDDSYDPESNYMSQRGADAFFDMDSLFAGLLDR
jgi:hypothetical protein